MTKEKEIINYLDENGMTKTLEKFTDTNDLIILLKISIDERKWYYINEIMEKIPASEEYDSLKLEILNLYRVFLDQFQLTCIISSISNDMVKLETLEKYLNKFDENHSISSIINSFNSDNLKCDLFLKYIECYSEKEFSDYLRKLKNDDIRTREFLKYKDRFDTIYLDWIALSYDGDEKRIKFFDKNFTSLNTGNIPTFIGGLDKDESKITCLDKYCELIPKNDMWFVTHFLEKKESKIDLINRYSDKMKSKDIKDLLKGIEDVNERFILLEQVSDKMESDDIIDLIKDIPEYSKRMVIFKRYIDRFTSENFYTMYIYLDSKYKDSFLDKYIEYFDSYSLYRIFNYENLTKDENNYRVSKYIDKFNAKHLSSIIKRSGFDRIYSEGTDIKEVSDKFINMAKDKDNLKTIYNALALANSDFFIDNLLNDLHKFFSDKDYKILIKLLDNNSYLFCSFIFDLLDIDILKDNFAFLEKMSKYETIAQEICDLHKNNPHIAKLLTLMIDYIYKQDINHDAITFNIINEITNSKFKQLLLNIDISKVDEDILVNLIFKLLKAKHSVDDNCYFIDIPVNTFDELRNYETNLDKKIDSIFYDSRDITDIKNCILNKHYGIDYLTAEKMIMSYGKSLDKFDSCSEANYIKEINYILKLDDIIELRNFYMKNKMRTIKDFIFTEQNIKKMFNRKIRSALFKITDKSPDTYCKYEDKDIPVYIPKNEFYLLVHSVNAYGVRRKIEDYSEFWNNNESFEIHGICCSILSNQNECKTAPFNDVLFGFDGFSDNAISLMNSTDMASDSSEFEIISNIKPKFMYPDDLIDNTRYKNNELVLERKELRENMRNNFVNIQPSYIVITSKMSNAELNRSFKAAKDLKVPLVYLDIEKIAENESTYINTLNKELSEAFDLDKFKEMIVRRENNIYSYNWNYPEINEKFFPIDEINNYMYTFFNNILDEFIKGHIDGDTAFSIYRNIVDILDEENEKRSNKFVDGALPIKDLTDKVMDYIHMVDKIENSIKVKERRK